MTTRISSRSLATWLFCAAMVILSPFIGGCCTPADGRPCSGWSVSLISVNIQLGGTSTRVDTDNTLGPNSSQKHSLPIDARFQDPVEVSGVIP